MTGPEESAGAPGAEPPDGRPAGGGEDPDEVILVEWESVEPAPPPPELPEEIIVEVPPPPRRPWWLLAAAALLAGLAALLWARPWDGAATLVLFEPENGLVTRGPRVSVRGEVHGADEVVIDGRSFEVSGDGGFVAEIEPRAADSIVVVRVPGAACPEVREERRVIVDAKPPEIALDDLPAAFPIERARLSWTVADEHGVAEAGFGPARLSVADGGRCTVDAPLAREGVNALELWTRDRAGNERRVTLGLVRDTVAPVLEVSAQAAGAGGTRLVAGRVIDANPAHLDVGGVRHPVDAGGRFLFAFAEGAVPDVAGVDAAGNRSAPLDLVPPEITLEPVPELTAAASIDVRGRVSERCVVAAAGVETETEAAFERRLALEPGPNLLAVVARDASGNESRAVRSVACCPARVVVEHPLAWSLLAGRDVELRGRVEGPSATAVLAGDVAVPLGPGGAFAARVLLSEGRNDLPLVALGTRGAVSPVLTHTVVADWTPPGLALEPLPELIALASAALRGLVAEDGCTVRVAAHEVCLEGARLAHDAALRPGPNVLDVFVRDAAGNTTSAAFAVERYAGPREGEPWTVPGLELLLQPVSRGTFVMGAADGAADEGPPHEVTISRGFWLAATELTAGACAALTSRVVGSGGAADLPVVALSWDEAAALGELLTEREGAAARLPAGYVYRLPTEAEWEHACRAGGALDLEAAAWYRPNSDGRRRAVGGKEPDAQGLHDLLGNVWEWCSDAYDARAYERGRSVDPFVAADHARRVVRGGSFGFSGWSCRPSHRSWRQRDERSADIGVRLALAPALVAVKGED